MESLAIIIAFSTIIWYLIDRAKTLWNKYDWGKWVTLGIALMLSVVCTFCFGLDLVMALGISGTVTVAGQIITVLILMSGSSGVSEIIQRIRGEEKAKK